MLNSRSSCFSRTAGCGVDGDEGADRGPRLGHRGGGRDPAAHHVTDEHGQPALAQVERVEEVTADLGAAGRAVVAGQLPAVDPRAEVGQHCVLQPLGGLHRLAVQLGVVDGERAAPGQVLGERDVGLGVPAAGLRGDPGDRAVHPSAGNERDHHDAAQLERPSQPEMLLVLGAGDEHLVGHLGNQVAAAGADDLAHATGCLRVRGIALGDLDRELHLGRVDVLDREPVQPPVLDDVDGAPVSERGHRQPRDLRHRHLVVEVPGKLRRCLGQEPHPGRLLLGLVERADAFQGLGAGVSEDAEELQLGDVQLAVPRERQRHHPERAPDHVQGKCHHRALALGCRLEVRVARLDRLATGEHEQLARPDHVAGGGGQVPGEGRPPVRCPVLAASHADQGDRVVVDHHRERCHRGPDGVRGLADDDVRHRLHVLGPAEVGGDAREPGQPVLQPAGLVTPAGRARMRHPPRRRPRRSSRRAAVACSSRPQGATSRRPGVRRGGRSIGSRPGPGA